MTHTAILIRNAFFRWLAYLSLISEALVSFLFSLSLSLFLFVCLFVCLLVVGLYQNYCWMNYEIFTHAEIQQCITLHL